MMLSADLVLPMGKAHSVLSAKWTLYQYVICMVSRILAWRLGVVHIYACKYKVRTEILELDISSFH